MPIPPWDSQRFGPALASLLGEGDRLPSLAPKAGEEGARTRVEALADKISPEVLAALYLYFDLLDPAHKIAQDIDTTTGSYLHAVMHRREPDDDNSAYWFRKAGAHPVLAALAGAAREHLEKSGDKGLEKEILPGRTWDPFAFIKACSEARKGGSSDRVRLLGELQLIEWRLLFEHCSVRKNDKPKRS